MVMTMGIGEKIRKFRQQRRMTQEKLAELVGVDQITISAYENDRRSIDVDMLKRIAEALQVPIKVFSEESENDEYAPIIVDPSERFEVIGKVVEIRRMPKRKRFRRG